MSIFSANFTGSKRFIFKLCGVSKEDLEVKEDKRIESRQLSPEEEAQELARFLQEKTKWKRLVFHI